MGSNNTKSGDKDTGSVAPVNTSSRVTRNGSQKNTTFAKGGNTPMFGSGDRTTTATQESAGPQTPGGTAHKPSGSGGKFPQGGSGKMFGYSPSVPATAGITSAR